MNSLVIRRLLAGQGDLDVHVFEGNPVCLETNVVFYSLSSRRFPKVSVADYKRFKLIYDSAKNILDRLIILPLFDVVCFAVHPKSPHC